MEACHRVGSRHPLVGVWVMINTFEREEKTLGRMLCVSEESKAGYVMEWISGRISMQGWIV